MEMVIDRGSVMIGEEELDWRGSIGDQVRKSKQSLTLDIMIPVYIYIAFF